MRQTIVSLVLLSTGMVAWAQEAVEVPNPPAIPTDEERARAEAAAKQAATEDDEANAEGSAGIEEKKTVEGSTTITEYSRGGQVYSFKLKQKYGATQYFDVQGDGQLEPANEELSTETNLPKWKITNW